MEYSKKLIEQPKFQLHQIYRALEVLAKENNFIQSELYKNSLKLSRRNDRKEIHATQDGEVAEKKSFELDEEKFIEESKYDGFYAVATNLEDDAKSIVKINSGRWEIEESFRINYN